MASSVWQVQAAKADLSSLIRAAEASGPQTITRSGKPVAVVVSSADFENLTRTKAARQGSLLEFFATWPAVDIPERDSSETSVERSTSSSVHPEEPRKDDSLGDEIAYVGDATADEVVANCNFLLDTNIISHVIRPKKRIAPGIERFLDTVDEERMYLSIVTFGEIEKGIGLIPWPSREAERTERARLQAVLEQRLEQLSDRFAGRIIDVDMHVARQWGRLHAKNERAGRKTPVVDTLIAACAITNRLVIATADADFAAFDLITAYNPISHTLAGYPMPNYFPVQR